MLRRQRDDQCATIEKERVDVDQQCGAGLLREICESRLDVAIAIAGVKDFDGNLPRSLRSAITIRDHLC